MGFSDMQLIVQALVQAKGNTEGAATILLDKAAQVIESMGGANANTLADRVRALETAMMEVTAE